MADVPTVRRTYIYWYCLLLPLAWIAVWRAHNYLNPDGLWSAISDTSFWIGMKLLVWVVPVFAAIRTVERRSLREFLELRNLRAGIRWAGAAAIVLTAADYRFVALPAGKHLGLPIWGAAFLNGVLVSPLAEEIVFRGFCLRRLCLNGIPFWGSNLLTTAVFIALHIVGWLFQSKIGTFAGLLRSIAPLLFLSLLFGWLKRKTGSLYAPVLLHFLNNLYAAALQGG